MHPNRPRVPAGPDPASRAPARAPNPAGERRATTVALVAALGILGIAAATRVGDTALWADEAWSLAATNDLGLSLRSTHGTMAAYYVPLWGWAQISDSTVWLRLLSTVAAAGTVLVTQRIARHVAGPRAAVLAPLVLVTNPMFLFTATEARGYALETLLTALAWYATLRISARRATTTERHRWQAALVVVACLGPLAHGLFIAQAAAIGGYVLLSRRRRTLLVSVAPALLATVVVTAVLWKLGLSSAGSVFALDLAQIADSLRGWYVAAHLPVALGVLAVLLAGVAATARRASRPGEPTLAAKSGVVRLAVPLWWTFGPLAALLVVRAVHTVWAPYYLSPITPGVAILIAVAIVGLDDAVGPVRVRRIGLGLTAAVVIVALTWSALNRPLRPVERWERAAAFVTEHARAGDGIVFSGGRPDNPTEARAPFEAALREHTGGTVPTAVSPARPLGEVLRVDDYLMPDELRTASARHDRIWVVDYRQLFDDTILTESDGPIPGFRLAREHVVPGGISVRLFERRATTP